MDERRVFTLAEEAMVRVVHEIANDQWGLPIPDWFPHRATDGVVTLRDIIDYHAYDDSWVPDMIAGRRIDEVGKDAHRGDRLGEDRSAAFAAIAERACEAVVSLEDLDRVVHTSFGDYPAREYLWQVTTFRGLRAHDIARLIGADPRLDDELVEGLWDEIAPHAEEWRAVGVYGPAISVPAEAPLQDRLLGLTGRQPDTMGKP